MLEMLPHPDKGTNFGKSAEGHATVCRQIAKALTTDFDVQFDQALDDTEQLVVFFGEAGLTVIETGT